LGIRHSLRYCTIEEFELKMDSKAECGQLILTRKPEKYF